MTDKKLTDKEIIDSLSNCALAHHNPDSCKECHYKDLVHVTCIDFITNDVIDLINRQKSEIERLKSANDEKFRQWDMLAEKTKQHYADLYNEAKDILKVEAYKEFAERLKEKSFKTIRNYGLTKDVVEVSTINNLLKEMVGENNG